MLVSYGAVNSAVGCWVAISDWLGPLVIENCAEWVDPNRQSGESWPQLNSSAPGGISKYEINLDKMSVINKLANSYAAKIRLLKDLQVNCSI